MRPEFQKNRGLGVAFAAVAMLLSPGLEAQAQEARAASGAPYQIGVFLENFEERCYTLGLGDAVRRFVEIEVDRINRNDGVSGRPVEPVFIEERSLWTRRNLTEAENAERQSRLGGAMMQDIQEASSGDLLGFVGPSFSSVNRQLFGDYGEQLGAIGAPFLVRTANPAEVAEHDYVYVARADDLERATPIARFMKAEGAQSVFFAARESFSGRPGRRERLIKKIQADLGPQHVAGSFVIETDEHEDWWRRSFKPDSVASLIERIKATKPDMVYLSAGFSARAAELIETLGQAGLTTPLFLDARLSSITPHMKTPYPGVIYTATRSGESLPGIADSTLDAVTSSGKPEDWIFSGQLNTAFAESSSDACAAQTEQRRQDFITIDSPRNESRLAAGAAAADMVRLIARAASSPGADASIQERRAAVHQALTSRYLLGRGVFEGAYDQWSFRRNRVAADRPPYFLKMPAGSMSYILAPRQFLRERPDIDSDAGDDDIGALREIATLYVDVDLIRAYNVNENDRTFFADFYLTIQAPDGEIDNRIADIANIEFANAYLDVRGGRGRQVAVQEVADGRGGAAFPPGVKVYKVSGRFFFTPSLRKYPFDRQLFAINVQPRRLADPFLIQPPPAALRDAEVDSDNWNLREALVTIENAAVPIVDTLRNQPAVAPFFMASYGWVMERETKDYFLRVLVPLGFILVVGYLSIFISRDHFEAIITIQVTALLSSVALYLAVPQVEADSTTVSDWIFLLSYLMISVMIAISICRINKFIARRKWLTEILRGLHLALIAPVILAFTIYSIPDVTTLVEWAGLVEPLSEAQAWER